LVWLPSPPKNHPKQSSHVNKNHLESISYVDVSPIPFILIQPNQASLVGNCVGNLETVEIVTNKIAMKVVMPLSDTAIRLVKTQAKPLK